MTAQIFVSGHYCSGNHWTLANPSVQARLEKRLPQLFPLFKETSRQWACQVGEGPPASLSCSGGPWCVHQRMIERPR